MTKPDLMDGSAHVIDLPVLDTPYAIAAANAVALCRQVKTLPCRCRGAFAQGWLGVIEGSTAALLT